MLTIDRLKKLKHIIKIEALCRDAGISYNSLNSAIARNTSLRQDVAQRLTLALRKHGIILAKEDEAESN
jgi:hypothetical protein